MKRKATKFVPFIALIIMLTLLSSMLLACNDKKKVVDHARIAAKNSFVLTILSMQNEKWTRAYTNEELSQMPDSGEYIIKSEWAGLAGSLLFESGLPTAKIEKIVNALNSEEWKKLLEDKEGQTVEVDKLFELFKSIGLTSVDISELLYDGIVKMLKGSNTVFDNCLIRLDIVRNNVDTNADVRQNLNAAIASIGQSKDSFQSFETSEEVIMSALSLAKNGMNALVNFAYRVSVSSLTTNIVGAISSGALENITNSEMLTYISSMAGSISELKTVLESGQLESLNSALNLVLNRFEKVVLSSNIFSEVLRYIRYAYRALDYLPIACDILKGATSAIDDSYITMLKEINQLQELANDENATQEQKDFPPENRAILVARLITKAMQGHTRESASKLIDKLAESAGTNNQKAIVLFWADLAINLFGMNDDGSAKFLEASDLAAMTEAAVCDANLSKIRTLFSSFQSGDTTVRSDLQKTANELIIYVNTTNETVGHASPLVVTEKEFTLAWYNKIVDSATAKLNENITKYKPVVALDLKKFVGYYFDTVANDISDLAGMEIVKINVGEEYGRLVEIYRKLKFNILFGDK